MNIIKKLQLSSFFILSLCAMTAHANKFLDAAQIQVDRVVNRKPIHKPSLEFKQAVMRYIKNTDFSCFANIQRNSDENIAYKKELRYLFKNYGTFSATTLLVRLRSAHQAMVKQDSNVDGDAYQQYEQICSALLLTVSQVFCNEMRNQILQALHDIDSHLAYWNYQHNHQIYYFFHKSPIKWIIGKEQAKEISHNISKLERKQRELYTLLGSLTEHQHSFTAIETTYENCYAWIEQLFEIVTDIKTSSQYNTDGSRFDEIAALLELKFKRVSKFKADCLVSITSAKKPNRFVRNWIPYVTAVAVIGYSLHYYTLNSTLINQACNEKISSLHESWTGFVVKPSEDLWQTIFGKIETPNIKESITDLTETINDLEVNYGVNKKTSDELREYLKKDRANTQKAMSNLLTKFIEEGKLTQEGCDEIINAEKLGDITKFQEFTFNMNKKLVGDLIQRDYVIQAAFIEAELNIYHYGSSLIQVVFELIVKYGIPTVKELLVVLAKGNKEWESACKKVNLILNVAVLTPTIILGLVGCNGLYKTYKWSTKRDYSPIRIALADINSLLIEAVHNLDDYQYGKLVYLICKLRHKATCLKDSLANEFLGDVAKLESKQYSAQTKHEIVENMFNKYAFLGKVTI